MKKQINEVLTILEQNWILNQVDKGWIIDRIKIYKNNPVKIAEEYIQKYKQHIKEKKI